MCGVPVHRADEYLQRLIAGGFRVAVCEQLEDPAEARKRGSKAVVHRDVVRLVTPGTLTEDSLLDAKARNYLTALFRGPKGGAGAGGASPPSIFHREFEVGRSRPPISLLRPAALPLARRIAADALLATPTSGLAEIAALSLPRPAAHFDSLAGERLLKAQPKAARNAAFGGFPSPSSPPSAPSRMSS
jgi:DNA mismatch repair protein MutS